MPVWLIVVLILTAPSFVVGLIMTVVEFNYRRNKRLHELGLPHNCTEKDVLRARKEREAANSESDDILIFTWRSAIDELS